MIIKSIELTQPLVQAAGAFFFLQILTLLNFRGVIFVHVSFLLFMFQYISAKRSSHISRIYGITLVSHKGKLWFPKGEGFGFPKGKGLVSQRGRVWFPKGEGCPVRGTEGNTQVYILKTIISPPPPPGLLPRQNNCMGYD